LEDRPVAKNK